MKALAYTGLVGGLAAVALLIAWQGFATVAGILAASGWGLLLLPIAWLPHLLCGAASWRMLFAANHTPRFRDALRALWIGGAVNTLLPVASIGGEVVKARVLALATKRGIDASASVVVDLTVQAASLLLWSFVGIAALVALDAAREFAAAALGTAALLGLGIAGFLLVQRGGAFGFFARLIEGITPKRPSALTDSAAEVDTLIRALYDRPGRIAAACALRLVGRVLLTAEVWFAAWLMGYPVGLVEALMLKSLAGALRGAAFPVPSGLGVQEGGYVMLGALIGYPPEVMLGLSLATRVRELLVSAPGLLAWQHAEGRALWRRLSNRSS